MGRTHKQAYAEKQIPGESGFISDTDGYKSKTYPIMDGHWRNRTQAFYEADECGQIVNNPYYLDRLNSEMLEFTPEQIQQAKTIVARLNAQLNKRADARLEDMGNA